ncbi:MAG: TAXI family TRAP transporter solute-binding subunit [Proteobacteria bacterium]|nr:TAXI family TRAP transporter solute-binding subunit [Pseudomonadota bacterium]
MIIINALTVNSSGRPRYITVGTGSVHGVYYPTGAAIANIVNRNWKKNGFHLLAQASSGSVFNVDSIISGDQEIGIVQSDRGYQAWHGLKDWENQGNQSKLRSIFSLHSETVNLIVSDISGIRSCSDLAGKRVAVGNIGSGTRQNSLDALSTCGLNFNDIIAEGTRVSERAPLLKTGRIDAFFYTVGHPSESIIEAISGRLKLRFIPFLNIQELIRQRPYYTSAEIPIDLYRNILNTKNIRTFGVKATLLTSEKVSESVIYAVTREVFENLEQFSTLHPALSRLEKNKMLEGLTAPLHPGAARYYNEVGLQGKLN